MTRIRATCPACGEVDLKPQDIQLCVMGTDPENVGEGSTYEFTCPDCNDAVSKPADSRIARLLASGGVPVSYAADPRIEAEVARARALLDHPEGVPVLTTPLTSDDLIDFHQLLESDDWFDELLTQTS